MSAMNEKDYYAILEVDEGASTDEIRRAFQKKARKLHPDVNKEPDAEERFKEVSEAYAVLSDAEKRKRYDAMRSGMPFAGGYTGYSSAPRGGYGSPFDGFPFGGTRTRREQRSRSYRPHPGGDVAVQVELDEETASKGTRRGITYERYATCTVCNGAGSVEHTQASTCPTCGGAGRMRVDLGGLGIFGLGFFEMTCPECEGSGKVVVDPCSACGGSGRILTASEIVVDIPAGTHDGGEVTLAGMGNAGTNGSASGDFVCQVAVAEERLSPKAETGFRFLGLGIPVLVIGLVFHLVGTALIGAILAGVGVAGIVRGDVHMNAYWWCSGGQVLISGVAGGIVTAVVLYVLSRSWFLYPLAFMFLIMYLPALISQRTR